MTRRIVRFPSLLAAEVGASIPKAYLLVQIACSDLRAPWSFLSVVTGCKPPGRFFFVWKLNYVYDDRRIFRIRH